MKEIKIRIDAGGDGLETPEDFFGRFMPRLLDEFKFIQEQRDPDFALIFSKQDPPSGKFVKILYAREYLQANLRKWDWGLGWQYEDQINSPYYIRFTNYMFNGAGENLIKGPEYDPKKILEQKTKFCAFVYFHKVPERDDFFEYMNKYYDKPIEAAGQCCNNAPPIGGHASVGDSRYSKHFYAEKVEYLKQFKFTIAFENRSAIGYTSEKIYNPMQANSIPVYWGNPWVDRDFNPNSFINAHDYKYKNMRDLYGWLIDRIAELDRNDDRYIQKLSQPWYHGNKCSPFTDREKIFNFFCRIFNSK